VEKGPKLEKLFSQQILQDRRMKISGRTLGLLLINLGSGAPRDRLGLSAGSGGGGLGPGGPFSGFLGLDGLGVRGEGAKTS